MWLKSRAAKPLELASLAGWDWKSPRSADLQALSRSAARGKGKRSQALQSVNTRTEGVNGADRRRWTSEAKEFDGAAGRTANKTFRLREIHE